MKSLEALEKIKVHSLSAITGEHSSPYNEYLQSETEFIKDYDIIKQDLERLKVLESNSNKVIKDSVALINKNLELQQRLEELEKENQELWYNVSKQAYLLNSKHIDSPFIERYQKAIEILKKIFDFEVKQGQYPINEYYFVDYFRANDTEVSKEQFDLLKEVLE